MHPRFVPRRPRSDDPRIFAPPARARLRPRPAHSAALQQPASGGRRFSLSGIAAPAERQACPREWTISPSTNRRVRVYEITKSGVRHLERQISSFDQMLEGIQLVLGPERRTANS